eukprot:Pompholyxophrys_punicea_v1_NODE_61_length_4021_cov_11.209730.p3 type:complete len:102 gc:universal NODE_61_length_4021_cov_11.209730:1229-924(-)
MKISDKGGERKKKDRASIFLPVFSDSCVVNKIFHKNIFPITALHFFVINKRPFFEETMVPPDVIVICSNAPGSIHLQNKFWKINNNLIKTYFRTIYQVFDT